MGYKASCELLCLFRQYSWALKDPTPYMLHAKYFDVS
jgi:hypothetical protein